MILIFWGIALVFSIFGSFGNHKDGCMCGCVFSFCAGVVAFIIFGLFEMNISKMIENVEHDIEVKSAFGRDVSELEQHRELLLHKEDVFIKVMFLL